MRGPRTDGLGLRGFIGSSSLLALAEAATRFGGLVIVMIVGRRFGAIGVGQLSVALAVALYVQVGSDFGFKTAAARLAAGNPTHIGEIASRTRRVRAKLFLACAALATGYWIWAVGDDPELGLLFALLVAAQAFGAVSADWLAWGMGDIAALAIYRVILQLGAAILSVAFVLSFGEMWLIGLGYLIAAAGAFVFVELRTRRMRFSPGPGSEASFPERLHSELRFRRVVPLGCTVALNSVYQTGELLVLQALLPWHDVGIYSAANRLILAACALMSVGSQVLFPLWVSSRSDESFGRTKWRAFAVVIMAASGATLALVVFAAPIIRIIYGAQFGHAVQVLRLLALAVIFDAACTFWVYVRNARGRYGDTLLITAAGAALNVIVAYVLASFIGISGAVAAKLIAYAGMCAIMWQWRAEKIAPAWRSRARGESGR